METTTMLRQWLISALLTLVPFACLAEENWPTPFTADQIRDEWVEGFWLITETEMPEGTRRSRTEVVEWSRSGAVLVERTVDQQGEAGEASAPIEVKWEQLRDHALFPKATTRRTRAARTTAFGELEGWLFSRTEGDRVTELFFADSLPGPPVQFWTTVGGVEVMRAEQIARGTVGRGREDE